MTAFQYDTWALGWQIVKHYFWKKWLTLISVTPNFQKLLTSPRRAHTHTYKTKVKSSYPSQANYVEKASPFCSNTGEEASLFTNKVPPKKHRKWAHFELYLYIWNTVSWTTEYQWLVANTVPQYGIIFSFKNLVP